MRQYTSHVFPYVSVSVELTALDPPILSQAWPHPSGIVLYHFEEIAEKRKFAFLCLVDFFYLVFRHFFKLSMHPVLTLIISRADGAFTEAG